MTPKNAARIEELERGCGTKKYEGHYKCRPDNLCPECGCFIMGIKEADANAREDFLAWLRSFKSADSTYMMRRVLNKIEELSGQEGTR